MPLKNLLWKGKKYDVSSRNAYVVCIHLLDDQLIECTLTSESTGQECLENIAQRIELNEIDYFGLRYVNKKFQFRWLELDKPLKKQLDKNAHSPLLYFGVMYYVPDAQAIEDQTTRYHYFLQLKSDVSDGKLCCTPDRAVLLAAYHVQRHFGDYEEGKHTVEFFKPLRLLPSTMSTDEHLLQGLNQEIVNTHRNLFGVLPHDAELQYIIEAQQLEGYGLDYFNAKTDSMGDIQLGISVIGIFLKPQAESETPTSYFKWSDIKKLVATKKALGIETSLSPKTVYYQLDDFDTVRYVHKMCLLQRQFCQHLYSNRQPEDAMLPVDGNLEAGVGSTPDIVQSVEQTNSTETEQVEAHTETFEQYEEQNQETFTPPTHRHLSASYPDVRLQSSSQQSNASSVLAQQLVAEYQQAQLQAQQQSQHQLPQTVTLDTALQDPGTQEACYYEYEGSEDYLIANNVGSLEALEPAQKDAIRQYMEAMGRSVVSLSASEPGHQNAFGSGQMYFPQSVSSVPVPQYRLVPDYQTVMSQLEAMSHHQQQQQLQQQQQQQLQQQQQQIQQQHQLAQQQQQQQLQYQVSIAQQNHIGTSQAYTQPETMSYSQPEISRTPPTYQQHMRQNNPQRNPAVNLQYSQSVLEHSRQSYQANQQQVNGPQPQQQQQTLYQPTGYGKPVDRTNSLNIHPTYSMPEINWRSSINQLSTSEIQLTDKVAAQQVAYKPPPPYRGLASNSTPDLASQAARLGMASSPELQLTRDMSNFNLRAQSQVDQSIENLKRAAQRMGISQEKIDSTSMQNLNDRPTLASTSDTYLNPFNVVSYASTGYTQSQEMIMYSSSGNVGLPVYGPQLPTQTMGMHSQPQLGSGNVGPQQQINGPVSVGQTHFHGGANMQQYGAYPSALTVDNQSFVHGASNLGPPRYVHHPLQYQGVPMHENSQFACSNLVQQGPKLGSTGNVMQVQYGSNSNIGPQQPIHYNSTGNVAGHPHYSSSGNIGPQAIQETNENEDSNLEVFITSPPNASHPPPPAYQPLMGQQQIFFGAQGVNLLNTPTNSTHAVFEGATKEHIYQNLPALSHQFEYGHENPYENLPEALDNVQMFGNTPEENFSEPGPKQELTPTNSVSAQMQQNITVNGHVPVSSQAHSQSSTSVSTQQAVNSSHHQPVNITLSLPDSDAMLVDRNQELQWRTRSVSTGSHDRPTVGGLGSASTSNMGSNNEVFLPRDRAVSTGSYERLLKSRNDIKLGSIPKLASLDSREEAEEAEGQLPTHVEHTEQQNTQQSKQRTQTGASQQKTELNKQSKDIQQSKPTQSAILQPAPTQKAAREANQVVKAPSTQSTKEANQVVKAPPTQSTKEANQVVKAPPTQSTKEANQVVKAPPTQSTKEANQVVKAPPTQSTKEANQVVKAPPTQSTKEANQIAKTQPTQPSKETNQIAKTQPTQPSKETNQIAKTQPTQPTALPTATPVEARLKSETEEVPSSPGPTGNDLDVLIPRPSTSSSFRDSPPIEPKSHYDEVDPLRMSKELSPSSSTSSAPPTPKALSETSMSSTLSVSRANIIELNDNDLRAPKDDRRKLLETKMEEGDLFSEFEQIPKKKVKCDDSCAQLEQNKIRNRFKDVLPYDSNRVKLTPTKHNQSGYINASHVKVRVKNKELWYIASQGPLENTVQDFWQMIWEQESRVIAMLTDLNEFGKQKCQLYWPEEKGSKNAVKFGDLQVTLKFMDDSGSFITRGLLLRQKKTKKERLVWHLQYTDWPDHSCPEDTYGFLAFLEEIESVRRHAVLEHCDERNAPVVVHCSAGVGRSGVVILAEVMKACLEHNENVDIATILGKMREQRMHLVQTVSQYTFVYKTLITYLKSSRLI